VYGYDVLGKLITRQDPGGNCSAVPKIGCTTMAYDADKERTSITYSDGATPNVTSTVYDADGQRTSMTDGTGTSTWVWDSLHRIASPTTGAGKTAGYSYDLVGNRTELTYPGTTGSVTQTYDSAGRLSAVTDWASHTTGFTYDANSNLLTQAYPNATTSTVTPNAADQVMGINDTAAPAPSNPFASFAYARDNANQVLSVNVTGVPTDTVTYSYSLLNQVKNVTNAHYGYDAADNLTALTSGNLQSFDPANELTTAVTPTVTVVGATSADETGLAFPLTLTLPAGTSTNDQVLLEVAFPSSGSVSTPTGYTLVTTTASGGNSGATVAVFRRTAVAGDTSVTVNFGLGLYNTAATLIVTGGSTRPLPLWPPRREPRLGEPR
jgi:YD repeat-containing protein